MEAILKHPIVKWVINIPWLWNLAQNILGENQWKREMYTSVFPEKKGTLLDFGCSIGNETEAFLDFDYMGVDTDAAAIQSASERFAAYPNVKFECVDVTSGFKKAYFDHVLFAATGHHLSDEDLRKVIPTLMDALKPGGKMHFFDHVRHPGKDGVIARAIIRIDQGKFVRTEEAYREFFDPNKVIVEEWRSIPSPQRLIKLPDFVYIRVGKPS